MAAMDADIQLTKQFVSGTHTHIMLLVGSIVSCTAESKCASVGAIRNDLVLRSLQRLCGRSSITRIIDEILHYDNAAAKPRPPGTPIPFGAQLKYLPFEQFMGCLASVNSKLAQEVIRITCGGLNSFRPNGIHRLIVALAESLLIQNRCRYVTIATTNFDQGFEQSVDWGPSSGEFFFRQLRVGRTGTLNYVKLHGCISDLSSCVFTISGLAERLYQPARLAPLKGLLQPSPTLVVSIGYSFSDPDLRTWLSPILNRADAMLFENVYNKDARDPYPTGPATLQAEFFRSLSNRPVRYRSDLFSLEPSKGELPNILALISTHLGVPFIDIPNKCDHIKLSPMVNRAVERSRIGERDVGRFMAQLADMCCTNAATQILKEEVTAEARVRDPYLLQMLLDSYAHINDLYSQLHECKTLINCGNDGIAAITCANASFAMTLGRTNPGNVKGALHLLVQGRVRASSSSPRIRAQFDHYWYHFWAKCIQKANLLCPPRLHRYGVFICFRTAAGAILPLLWLHARLSQRYLPLHQVAAAEMLVAQMMLQAGFVVLPQKVIERAKTFYGAAGYSNGVTIADRTEGWRLFRASQWVPSMQILARGMLRAVTSQDISLATKLGADILRVAWESHQSSIKDVNSARASNLHEHLIYLSEQLQPLKEDAVEHAVAAIAAEVHNCYGEHWPILIEELRRCQNHQYYPVFLPCEPATQR